MRVRRRLIFSILLWYTSISMIISNIPLYAGLSFDSEVCLLTGIELTNSGVAFLWRSQDGAVDIGQIKKAISLYYSALAIPTRSWWVDLYLWNTDRQVLGKGLERTDLGDILVKSDLELKRLVQQVLNSEKASTFWSTVEQLGYGVVSPRFWVEPGEVSGLMDKDTFKIYKAKLRLRVAIEDPRINKRDKRRLEQILMRLVVPTIERKLNSGEEFSSLRSAYYAMLLAAWTKEGCDMPSEILYIKDSYILPDIGKTQVNTYGYLIKFCRELLSNQVDLSSVIFLGGGGEYENIPEVIKDGIKGVPDVHLDEVKQAKERKIITDIPKPENESDSQPKTQIWKNKASEFGLDPNSVFVFGNVHFSGVNPKEIVGPNVVIANLSKDELVINKDFVRKYSSPTKWYRGKLFSSLVVKHTDGKIRVLSIADIKTGIDASEFVDTVGKIKSLFDGKVFPGDGNILFIQTSRQRDQKVSRDRLGKIRGIKIFVVNTDVSSVKLLKPNKFLYPLYTLSSFYYRWPRVSKEEREDMYNQAKILADWITNNLSLALRGEISLYDAGKKLVKILDMGGRYINGKFIKLNGTVVDIVDREIVNWSKKNTLSDVRQNWLIGIRKKLLNYVRGYYETSFKGYIHLDKSWPITEQLKVGMANLKKMLRDTAINVFGGILAEYNLHISQGDTLPVIFQELSMAFQQGASDKERNIIEDISFANSLSEIKEILRQIKGVELSEKREKDFIELAKMKELVILQDIMNNLFSKVMKKSEIKIITPNATNIRLAYYPLQGGLWDIEDILAVLNILATGQIDKLVITVSAGVKESNPTSKILSGPIMELLAEYIFGGLVEFSDTSVDGVKYFNVADEEMIPDIMLEMSMKLEKGKQHISSFYYVTDPRHAKFMAVDKISVKKRVTIEKEISYLNEHSIPVGYDDGIGLFYSRKMEESDSEISDLLVSIFGREKLKSMIEDVLSEIGILDDVQKVLRTKEEQIQILSRLPLVLAKLSEVEEKVGQLEQKQIKMGKTLRNFLRTISHLYSGYNHWEEDEDTNTPDKVGGLMLSRVNLLVE